MVFNRFSSPNLRNTYRIASISRFLGLLPVVFLLPAFDATDLAKSFETWQLLAATLVAVWQTALFNIALPLMADHGGKMPPVLGKIFWGLAIASGLVAAAGAPVFAPGIHPATSGLLILAWSLNVPEHLAFAQGKRNTLIFLTTINGILPLACMVVPVWIGLPSAWFWGGTLLFFFTKAATTALLFNISPNPGEPTVYKHFLQACLQGLVTYGGDFSAGWIIRYALPDQFLAYRYGMKELPFVLLVSNAISNEFSMTLRQSGMSLLPALREETGRLMKWAFPISWAGAVAAPVLFAYFPDPGFIRAIPVFCIGSLLTIPRVCFPQAILRAKMDQRALSLASVIEMIVYLLMLVLLIPIAGAIGAVSALVFATALEKALLARRLDVSHGISPGQYIPVREFLILSALSLLLAGIIGWGAPTLLSEL